MTPGFHGERERTSSSLPPPHSSPARSLFKIYGPPPPPPLLSLSRGPSGDLLHVRVEHQCVVDARARHPGVYCGFIAGFLRDRRPRMGVWKRCCCCSSLFFFNSPFFLPTPFFTFFFSPFFFIALFRVLMCSFFSELRLPRMGMWEIHVYLFKNEGFFGKKL